MFLINTNLFLIYSVILEKENASLRYLTQIVEELTLFIFICD